MNQKLAIILILVAGGMGIAYSTSGQIQIGPTSCIGLACDSNDFTNYNTIVLNSTVFSGYDTSISQLTISNNGVVGSVGSNRNGVVLINGTVTFEGSPNNSGSSPELDQTTTGKYLAIFKVETIKVFKNGVFLQDLGVNTSQFTSRTGLAISPDGHYIALMGKDSGSAHDRLIIFGGS